MNKERQAALERAIGITATRYARKPAAQLTREDYVQVGWQTLLETPRVWDMESDKIAAAYLAKAVYYECMRADGFRWGVGFKNIPRQFAKEEADAWVPDARESRFDEDDELAVLREQAEEVMRAIVKPGTKKETIIKGALAGKTNKELQKELGASSHYVSSQLCDFIDRAKKYLQAKRECEAYAFNIKRRVQTAP